MDHQIILQTLGKMMHYARLCKNTHNDFGSHVRPKCNMLLLGMISCSIGSLKGQGFQWSYQ